MRSEYAIDVAEEQVRCHSFHTPGTESCTSRAADADAVRLITLSQLWGPRALEPGRSAIIGAAITSEDLRAIGRLHHALFAERDSRNQVRTDCVDRLLIDPIDAVSLNLRAASQQRCLAAARLTFGADAVSDPRLAATLHHSALPQAAYPDCLILSHMAVRPEARARALVPALARHVYRVGLETAAAMTLRATRPAHVQWFERFGCARSGPSWTDPDAGELHCLVLGMLDRARLKAVGSPLLVELDAFEAGSPGAAAHVSILDLTDDL